MVRQTHPGTYVLVMMMEQNAILRIGGRGLMHFEAGCYLYVGSALNGLENRLNRHLRREKRVRWHIDYLLRRATISQIWYSVGRARLECVWARRLAETSGVQPFPQPFGASDCACRTHLFYANAHPDLSYVRTQLAQGLPEDNGPLRVFAAGGEERTFSVATSGETS
jgi:Uri superfamily endonuclease